MMDSRAPTWLLFYHRMRYDGESILELSHNTFKLFSACTQVSGHSCDEASKDISLIESLCNAIRDIDLAKDLINIYRNQHLGYFILRNAYQKKISQ